MSGYLVILTLLAIVCWMLRHEVAAWVKGGGRTQDDQEAPGGDWETSWTNGGRHVHFLPLKDGQRHLEAPDCHCGPATQRFQRGDGTAGLLMIHHRTPEETRR